jgi:hypothetical protein
LVQHLLPDVVRYTIFRFLTFAETMSCRRVERTWLHLLQGEKCNI